MTVQTMTALRVFTRRPSVDADPSLNALFAVDHELFGAETPIPNPFWSRWLERRGEAET